MKFPIVDNKLMKNDRESCLDDVYKNKEDSIISKEYLDDFDFSLKYNTSDPLINEGRQKTIEISHNTVTIDNGLGTPFVRIRMIGEKHFIPINKIIELKKMNSFV